MAAEQKSGRATRAAQSREETPDGHPGKGTGGRPGFLPLPEICAEAVPIAISIRRNKDQNLYLYALEAAMAHARPSDPASGPDMARAARP